MSQHSLDQVHIVDLSWSGSLYESSSDGLLARLENLVASPKLARIVILRAHADLHDYSNSWLQFLRDDAIWQDLYQRLERWHILFAKIIQSKSKFFFLSGRDVVGSWWELAIACHGRVFTNPYSKVGLPEVYIDIFPPLGIFGLKRYAAYDDPQQVRKHAILHAREAFKERLIDLCLLSDDWAEQDGLLHLNAWFEHFIPNSDTKVSVRSDYIREIPKLQQIEQQRTDAATRSEWLGQVRVDAAFTLLKGRNSNARAEILAHLRAAGAARFLQVEYRAWLSRRITRYRLGLHDRWWNADSQHLIIDVSDGLPPQEVVKNLLLRRKRLIFTSPNHLTLRAALETIRTRFDRRDSAGQDAYALWDYAVHWACGPAGRSSRGTRCSFHANDRVTIERGTVKIDYLRISGNFGHAGIGWYEQLTPEPIDPASESIYSEITETIALMANGILTAKKPLASFSQTKDDLPLTIGLRFLLLEFLLRLGERIRRCESIIDLLKLMGDSGWGFAADQYQWDNLLKHYEVREGVVGVFASFWHDETERWRILELNDIFTQAYDKNRPKGLHTLDVRSGAAATRLLGVFANTVVSWLVRESLVANRDEADLFVSLAWGYPGVIPLPSALEQEIGSTRLKRWTTRVQLSSNP